MRDSLRRLLHDRTFAAIAIVTLGLGIGANTAIFSLIKTVLLRPLPYGQPDDIVVVWNVAELGGVTNLSASEIRSYGEAPGLWLGGYLQSAAIFEGAGGPERARAAWVTHDLFEILRVPAAHGRTFTAADVAGDNTVIISHGLWMRQFGGRADVVGTNIDVNGRKRTLLGVMPEGFRLPLDFREDRPAEAWTPIGLDNPGLSGWGNRSFIGVGRLKPGFTRGAVTAQLHAKSSEWIRAGYVRDSGDGQFSNRQPIQASELLTGGARRTLLMLFGAVGVVLLIAIANVTNLLLARGDARRHEAAIRTALGASRAQLIRQTLIESVMLSTAGAVFGVALAAAGLRVLIAFQPANLPRAGEAGLDAGVLIFTAIVSLVAGVTFGIAPALSASKLGHLTPALREGARGGTASRARQVLRGTLVVSQVAMSVVLVLAAGLLARSLVALTRVDPGFETANILTAQFALPVPTYPRNEDVIRFYRQATERLQHLPGVAHAGGIRIIPLTRQIGNWSITIEGQSRHPNDDTNGDFQWVLPGYFETLGLRMLEGRAISTADREDSLPVVVINDTMAARYWPGEHALGRRFKMGTGNTPMMTIVGIVATSRHNAIAEEPRAEMFLAHAQLPRTVGSASRSMAIVIRTHGDPLTLVDGLKTTIRDIDPKLPVSEIQTMDAVMGKALSQPRFTASLLVVFASLALVLAAVGVYGMISLLVAERSREIGIRMALGARRATILSMIMRRSLTLGGLGIAAGLGAAALIAPLLETLLYAVKPMDPLTFAAVPAVLLLVVVAGSVAPARRATRVNPITALR